MAQNVIIANVEYSDVPAVDLTKVSGGTARFVDTSDANAVAANILSGYTAYVDGSKITGTYEIPTSAITNTLTHCSSSDKKNSAVTGQSYVENIATSSGYIFESDDITVTMGGTDITSSVLSTATLTTSSGKISRARVSIPTVSGAVTIVASGTQAITNWVDSVGVANNTRISSSQGTNSSASGFCVVGSAMDTSHMIPLSAGDVIYVTGSGVTFPSAQNYASIALYSSSGSYAGSGYYRFIYSGQTSDITCEAITGGYKITPGSWLTSHGVYFRLCIQCSNTSDLIVTVNQDPTSKQGG